MDIKEARKVIHAGLAWASWTDEQQTAMKVALEAMSDVERIEKKKNADELKLFNTEEWEYILAACEDLSCGYNRTDHTPHCCDLNEVVPKIRRMLEIPTIEDVDD